MTPEQDSGLGTLAEADVPALLTAMRGHARRRVAQLAVLCLVAFLLIGVAQVEAARMLRGTLQADSQRAILNFALVPVALLMLTAAAACRIWDRPLPALVFAGGLFLAAASACITTWLCVANLGSPHRPSGSGEAGLLLIMGVVVPYLSAVGVFRFFAPLGRTAFFFWVCLCRWRSSSVPAGDVSRMMKLLQENAHRDRKKCHGNWLALRVRTAEDELDHFGFAIGQRAVLISCSMDNLVWLSQGFKASSYFLPHGLAVLVDTRGVVHCVRLSASTLVALRCWAGLADEGSRDVSTVTLNRGGEKSYDEISSSTVSVCPASGRIAFAARRSDQWAVVCGDTESPPFAGIATQPILFLPDGRSLAFAASRLGCEEAPRRPVWYLIAGEKEDGPWDEIGPIALDETPDGFGVYGLCHRIGASPTEGWLLSRISISSASPAGGSTKGTEET